MNDDSMMTDRDSGFADRVRALNQMPVICSGFDVLRFRAIGFRVETHPIRVNRIACDGVESMNRLSRDLIVV